MKYTENDIIENMMLDSVENNLPYQNLNEIDSLTDATNLADLFNKYSIAKYPMKYWDYMFGSVEAVKNSVGKFWYKGNGLLDLQKLEQGIKDGVFEYVKTPAKGYGVVCMYTTEDGIQSAAEWIKKNMEDKYERNISYKFDIDTINGGKSRFKIQDLI